MWGPQGKITDIEVLFPWLKEHEFIQLNIEEINLRIDVEAMPNNAEKWTSGPSNLEGREIESLLEAFSCVVNSIDLWFPMSFKSVNLRGCVSIIWFPDFIPLKIPLDLFYLVEHM